MHCCVFGPFKYARLLSRSPIFVFILYFLFCPQNPPSLSSHLFPSHFISQLIDCKAFGYGSYRGLNLGFSSMALIDLQAMCAGKNGAYNREINCIVYQLIGRNYCSFRSSGMAFEPDRFKPKRSSLPAVQIVHSETSFKPCILAEQEMCFSMTSPQNPHTHSRTVKDAAHPEQLDSFMPIIPGLPDDVAMYCLALVPRSNFPNMGTVCKRWRSFIQSKEFMTVRKDAGRLEEWLYVLKGDAQGHGSHWEALGCAGEEHQLLPPMPGTAKAAFGVVVLDGKLLVIGGYSADSTSVFVSSDMYQYDSRLNSWGMLGKMNVARYDFACAEVDGMVYAVGGYGADGQSLSCAEVYDPEKNAWTLIESLRRPRWGCFACGFEGKLYVMGGRSSFTIGNSRFVDVYNPEKQAWCEMKNGCVMVTAHAVVGKKLFCMEWKNQRKLAIFDPEDNSWKMVPVPLTGSSRVGFRFGIFDGKLLLFSAEEEPGYRTLLYDPDAAPGKEWETSEIKPSGLCLCSVTIKA
ncbi:hypothetical protein ACLOJK_039844 [Asimina triloba]